MRQIRTIAAHLCLRLPYAVYSTVCRLPFGGITLQRSRVENEGSKALMCSAFSA